MGPENRLFRIAPGEKREGPSPVSDGPSSDPGNDLLSRGKHYHRPRMLNGRVRNGNGCGHPGLVTGSFQELGAGNAECGAENVEVFRSALRDPGSEFGIRRWR